MVKGGANKPELAQEMKAVRSDLRRLYECQSLFRPRADISQTPRLIVESGSPSLDVIRGYLSDYDAEDEIRNYLNLRQSENEGRVELERVCGELEKLENGENADTTYLIGFFDDLAVDALYLSKAIDRAA